MPRRYGPSSSSAPPKPATPAPIVPSPAASSCIPRATSRRASRPTSSTSKATPTIRPIAARSARRARRCSTSCTPRRAPNIRRSASPARDKFERVSWDVALDRIARLMKDDRDKNFIAKNNDGVTVNRWLTTGFLAASATTNETAFVDLQGRAQRRDAGLRQSSARLTRPDGGQSGSNIRPRRDDEFVDRYQEHGSRRHHGRQCRRGASVRLQVGHRGEGQPWRQADRRRSALHALGVGRRFLRADPPGHRHRLPARRDQLLHRTTTRCSGTTSRPSPTRPTS